MPGTDPGAGPAEELVFTHGFSGDLSMTAAQALDFASVFVFALTGALVASRAQLDVIGFLFIAALTAVGGGTVRDVILNREQVFWVGDPTYIGVAAAAGLIVFVGAPHLESRYRAILWLDAVALPVAVTAGVSVAHDLGASIPVIVIMGMITGSVGGLLRDVVCNEVPLVLKQGELYVTAAFAGALAGALGLAYLGRPTESYIACALLTFALRAGSLAFGWRLPTYKSRPPRV